MFLVFTVCDILEESVKDKWDRNNSYFTRDYCHHSSNRELSNLFAQLMVVSLIPLIHAILLGLSCFLLLSNIKWL